MSGLPCERCDPLGVAFESVTKWFTGLRVPEADVAVVTTGGEDGLER